MPIILAKPKVISKEKQEELKAAGYIVIEVADPKDVIIMDESPSLERDALLDCAFQALDWGNDSTARNAFGTLLRNRLMSKPEPKHTKTS